MQDPKEPSMQTELPEATQTRLLETFNELLSSLDEPEINPNVLALAIKLNNENQTLKEIEEALHKEFPFEDINEIIRIIQDLPGGSIFSEATVQTMSSLIFAAAYEIYGKLDYDENTYGSVTFTPLKLHSGEMDLMPQANLDIIINPEDADKLETKLKELLLLITSKFQDLKLESTWFYPNLKNMSLVIDDNFLDCTLTVKLIKFGNKFQLKFELQSGSKIHLKIKKHSKKF